jgi:D-alanyl-D-alanine carboxypeptidase (penicillin-binding protein 5/6)
MARFFPSSLLLVAALLAAGLGASGAPSAKPATSVVPKATPVPSKPLPPAPPGELALYALGAIVIDAHTGETLYEKNADIPRYPASTTKIMTALMIIEAGELDREVECTLEDSKVGESSLELKPGQRYSRRQMLYGLMLKSANDVAHALGRDNAGSAEAFCEKMTVRARELGATKTNFKNPNGLHHLEHYASPRDLAAITRAAMQQPLFRKIVRTRSFDWLAETGQRPLTNHNRLLQRFPGCTGVKTGYTIPAQQVLVSSALRGNQEVIAVVMYTNKPGIWDDSMLLLSYGLDRAVAKASKATAGN